MTTRYRREQSLMLSTMHNMGMKTARDHLGSLQQQPRAVPTSWLGQQRKNVRAFCRYIVRCLTDTYFPTSSVKLYTGDIHFTGQLTIFVSFRIHSSILLGNSQHISYPEHSLQYIIAVVLVVFCFKSESRL